jgi:hypothetical protein
MAENHTDLVDGGISAKNLYASGSKLHSIFFEALVREHHPVGFTDGLILDDIARRAAQVRHQDAIADALETKIHRAVESAGILAHGGEEASSTAVLAAIAASERLEAIRRLSLGCSRAFYAGICQLSQRQRDRRDTAKLTGEIDDRFQTDEQCLVYLIRRFQRGEYPCPRCQNATGGCWIATRRAWECGRCKSQTGIRAGTVMEHSGLPLTSWFKGIRMLVLHPGMSVSELSQRTGITRLATVRAMAKKIRSAMETNPKNLAGLDELCNALPEISDRLD